MTKSVIAAISRRNFLNAGAAVVGGALVIAPTALARAACMVTEGDILGPYYRFGAPFQTPLGVAADRNGNIFVTDAGAGRITKLAAAQ